MFALVCVIRVYAQTQTYAPLLFNSMFLSSSFSFRERSWESGSCGGVFVKGCTKRFLVCSLLWLYMCCVVRQSSQVSQLLVKFSICFVQPKKLKQKKKIVNDESYLWSVKWRWRVERKWLQYYAKFFVTLH